VTGDQVVSDTAVPNAVSTQLSGVTTSEEVEDGRIDIEEGMPLLKSAELAALAPAGAGSHSHTGGHTVTHLNGHTSYPEEPLQQQLQAVESSTSHHPDTSNHQGAELQGTTPPLTPLPGDHTTSHPASPAVRSRVTFSDHPLILGEDDLGSHPAQRDPASSSSSHNPLQGTASPASPSHSQHPSNGGAGNSDPRRGRTNSASSSSSSIHIEYISRGVGDDTVDERPGTSGSGSRSHVEPSSPGGGCGGNSGPALRRSWARMPSLSASFRYLLATPVVCSTATAPVIARMLLSCTLA
jgi:hypothetical protein